MDHTEFERRLFPWIDGELPAAEAAEMDAFCRAHPEAHARAERERAFEARVGKALLAGVDGREVVAKALASTRPAGKVVRFPRWASAAAAAVVAAVGLAWFNCVPPFECPFVSAIESAAEAPAAAVAANSDPCPTVIERLRASGATIGDESPVTLEIGGFAQIAVNGLRRKVKVDGVGEVALISFACCEDVPSCRNKREVGTETWWVAEEAGKHIVCVPATEPGSYVAIVGPQTEETLIGFARSLKGSPAPRE
jgi:hypothetical protein